MNVSESTRHLQIKTVDQVFSAPKAIIPNDIKTTIGIIPSQIF